MTKEQIRKYNALVDEGVSSDLLDTCLGIWGNIDDTLQKIYEYQLKDWGIELSIFED